MQALTWAPMTLRVALIGCGKIADGHVQEIQKLGAQARLVAVCDKELLVAEQLARRFGIPQHYDDIAQLLERERPDVVHVTTPPQTHLRLGEQLLSAGCHVYMEKPFTLNHDEAVKLITAAERAHRKITVGYSSYFDPPALAMRELIAQGAIGTPVHVESFYGYDLSGAFGKALLSDRTHWVHRLPGKLLHNVIDHMLNKVMEFVPDDDPYVDARGYSLRPGGESDSLHDELRVLIQGERTSGYATFSSHVRPAGQFVRVCGTKNTLRVDYIARTVALEAGTVLPSAFGRLLLPFQDSLSLLREGGRNLLRFATSDYGYFAGLKSLISSFYRSIEEEGPLPISHRDILRICRLMDRIFAQLEERRAA
jgi:predicted dehydrogenase